MWKSTPNLRIERQNEEKSAKKEIRNWSIKCPSIASIHFFHSHSKIGTALFFLLLLFIISSKIYAQTPHFKTYEISKENRQLKPQILFQDSKGFIWLGTSEGLYQYNGIDFHLFPLADSLFTKTTQSVTAIFEDQKERLWVGFQNGIIASFQNLQWTLFEPEEGLPKVPITAIEQDPYGTMWFATYGEGLYYYLPIALQNSSPTSLFIPNRLYNINIEEGLSSNDLYDIAVGKNGKIWAATDSGISICSIEEGKKHIELKDMTDGLPDNLIQQIEADKNGNLWIGTNDKGVCQYRFEEEHFYISPQMKDWIWGSIKSLEVQEQEVWIGTQQNGLIQYVLQSSEYFRAYNQDTDYTFGMTNSVLADWEGNIWFTGSSNVLHSTNRKFEFIQQHEGVSFNHIEAILSDSQNNIWFSNKEGLFRHSIHFTGFNVLEHCIKSSDYSDLHIIAIYEDIQGYIWLGTFGKGVYRLNPKNKHLQHLTESEGLINNNVLSISGKDAEIWLATLGGVSKCILDKSSNSDTASLQFENYDKNSGLGNNYIYSTLADSKGRIWFATDGQGITVLEKGNFTNYADNVGLKGKVVYSIAEDKQGNIWFSTANAGIYRFDGIEFKNFDLREGLRERQISSIAMDGQNNLLIAHRQGIDLLNTETLTLTYYGQEVGLNDITPALNAISKDPQGNIWLGTQNSIIKYLQLADSLQLQPTTHINQVFVFLEPIVPKSHLSFPYYQNHISFDYIGLWYTHPEQVTYQHQLEGYDREWINTKDKFVTYPNLPAGDYIFKLRSSIHPNFKEAAITEYAFRIRPAFWETTWFILIIVILSIITIYYTTTIREARLKKEQALEQQQLRFQLDALKNQINPHFLFNSFNTLLNVIEENQTQAAKYVEKLSDFFRTILTHRDKDLITLEEELALIQDYYYIQQHRYGTNFQLNVHVDPAKTKKMLPPLTLQMLLENAVKHNIISKRKPLTVDIYNEGDSLFVKNPLQLRKVSQPSTKVGLQNIQKRYELLTEQQIHIEEIDGFFVVKLPLL
ncbi:MAG: two-component regulator propeller domain-containing protein [Chitinophagales bacterium]